MVKIGLIINPVAGIGGKVGLKGSDGEDTLKKALSLGAAPESEAKAIIALKELTKMKGKFNLYTCRSNMGALACESAGIDYTVIGEGGNWDKTSASNTEMAARRLVEEGIDLLLFAGGDGTARNIMDAVGTNTLALGIPTGCKIHSGVYAINPRSAGILVNDFIAGRVRTSKIAEVMDIDENLFRNGIVQARLYGYLKIPVEEKLVQNLKSGGKISEEGALKMIANYLSENMERNTLYIIGTGSTIAAIMGNLGYENTLLGVDLLYNGDVIARDCTENDILKALEKYVKAKIIVTVIGGQGYIFGRGNQQISCKVIEKVGRENILIVATPEKIAALFGQPLYVDTGDEVVDHELSGYMRVVTGYEREVMMKVTN